MMFFLAAAFLVVATAFAISETLANEVEPAGYTEVVIEPGGGKVVPPGWCLEHGYIAIRNPDNPYVCILCD